MKFNDTIGNYLNFTNSYTDKQIKKKEDVA